jgi:hypothetical protein
MLPDIKDGSIPENSLKLSWSAYDTVKRASAHTYLELIKDEKNREACDKVNEIARHWNDEDELMSLRSSLRSIIDYAKANPKVHTQTGDIQHLMGTKQEIAKMDKKLEESRQFKDDLRHGKMGIFGQMVGANLLAATTWDPTLLDEPMVVLGGHFVVDFLKDEQKDNEFRKTAPGFKPEFQGFLDATDEALKEIEPLVQKIEERQKSMSGNVQNPDTKI